MYLCFEQDDHIQAKIGFPSLADRHRPRLAVGSVYYIQNFGVKRANAGWRVVTNDYIISFTWKTSVHEIPAGDNRIKDHKFEFLSFNDVHTRSENDSILTGK